VTFPARLVSRRAGQRGVGMVETMVGILIGMIVIVVVFNVLSVAEGYKRATVGTSDAQITGLLSQFVAGRDASNGGAGITMSGTDMVNCTKNEGNVLVSALPLTSLDAAIRPIPVLITDGGAPGTSDSFISYSAGAAHVMWPVDFTANSAAGAAIIVQSPNGFTVPVPTAAKPYWAIAMTNDPATPNVCKLIRVTAAVPDPTLPLTGKVTLTQDAALKTGIAYNVGPPARLLNLGPQDLATRIQYDVDQANAVLRSTDLLVVPPNPLVPVPIAQNIVLMKVQYGIGSNLLPNGAHDGIVTCWTEAIDGSACSNGVDNNFSDNAVRGFTLNQFNSILAVRIGVVVRNDEPDLRLLTDPTNPELIAESRAIVSATRPPIYLFNCSANTNAACQGRVQVPMGLGASPTTGICAPNVICDYWRYRVYETIVPIRNAIYSATMIP
jgi:hypothetical protein